MFLVNVPVVHGEEVVMSRSVALGVLGSLFALVVGACAPESSGTHKNAVKANNNDPNAAPSDPNAANGDDTTEQPSGPVDDGGVAGGDTGSVDGGGATDGCTAAPSGWRPMAKVKTTDTTMKGSDSRVAWSGRLLFDQHTWSTTPCTPGMGCTFHHEELAYDPLGDVWSMLPSVPGGDVRVYYYGASVDGKWVLFSGGLVAGHDTLMDGAIYDPTTNLWTLISPAPLVPRTEATVVALPSTHEILVWGGMNDGFSAPPGTSGFPQYTDGAAYSLVTGKWRTIATSPFTAGADPITSWDGARLIMAFPSVSSEGEMPTHAAAAYDPKADAWSTLPLPSVSARVASSFAAVDRGVGARASTAFWGGFTAITDGDMPTLRDGAWLDSSSGGWTTIPDPGLSLVPQDLTRNVAFGAKGRFYLWGGQLSTSTSSGSSTLFRGGIVYDLSSGTWSRMPTAGAPSPRSNAVAVWTGCDAIVFGGWSETGWSADGARFRP